MHVYISDLFYVCVYFYINNKYTQYTNILCKQKLLFRIRLIAINHLTALNISVQKTKKLNKVKVCALSLHCERHEQNGF